MPRRLVIRPLPAAQIEEYWYYLELNAYAEVAARFRANIATLLESLLEFPKRGRLTPHAPPSAPETRSIAVPGFPDMLVFYRVTQTTVEVIRVIHGMRDLPSELQG